MVHDISYSLLAGQRRVLGEGEHAPRRSDPPMEPAYARLGRLPRSAHLLHPDAPDIPEPTSTDPCTAPTAAWTWPPCPWKSLSTKASSSTCPTCARTGM